MTERAKRTLVRRPVIVVLEQRLERGGFLLSLALTTNEVKSAILLDKYVLISARYVQLAGLDFETKNCSVTRSTI